MAKKHQPATPGPHTRPLSEQQHRLVVEGRRLGDTTEKCTVVLMWDQDRQQWVFYLHAVASMAACFSAETVEEVARHVLDRVARKAS